MPPTAMIFQTKRCFGSTASDQQLHTVPDFSEKEHAKQRLLRNVGIFAHIDAGDTTWSYFLVVSSFKAFFLRENDDDGSYFVHDWRNNAFWVCRSWNECDGFYGAGIFFAREAARILVFQLYDHF